MKALKDFLIEIPLYPIFLLEILVEKIVQEPNKVVSWFIALCGVYIILRLIYCLTL